MAPNGMFGAMPNYPISKQRLLSGKASNAQLAMFGRSPDLSVVIPTSATWLGETLCLELLHPVINCVEVRISDKQRQKNRHSNNRSIIMLTVMVK